MTHPTDAAIAQAFRERLESMYSPLTVREVMKAVETRARELDAAKPEQVHTCSYYCDRPGCLKAQRDELRDRLEGLDGAKGGEEPERELLVSMAVRLDHGFGLRDEEWQAATLRDMRKVWEEVMGRGFYSPERKAFYSSMTTPPAQAAEAVERVAWAIRSSFYDGVCGEVPWDELGESHKNDWRTLARAAIAAMQECAK